MSGYKRVSFYELCRLCASNTQKEKTHIFQEEGRKIQLKNKIQVCLALTVNENDFLPKVVCSKCLRSLETCYGFRQECVRSESMLSTYFTNFRYTEDFKKSGKVYIKDIKSSPPIILPLPVDSTPSGPQTQVQSISQNTVNVNKNQQTVEQVPFYTLQLPAIVSNPNIVNKRQKPSENTKTSQNQLAYNLNLVNTANVKASLPKTEILSNVVVNSNGEVINIAHMGDFETILNQGNALKAKNRSTKRKDVNNVREGIVQIDLTESDNSEYDVEGNSSKFDKLPHIKSTQPQTKYSYSVKIEDKNQNQTVILPLSEYSQNYNNFNTNNVYTQANMNLVSTNSTNVISNTATTINSSALNVINQNLQEINQPAYTNVISTNVSTDTDICKTDLDQSTTNSSINSTINNPVNNNSSTSSTVKHHVCEICQRAFKRREHLYQHVKLHTGFRPYTCVHCNKAFMRKEHLLRHSTLHSGQKNFTCNSCGKSFSRNDNLLKHKKTHEKQASYTCEICQKQFVIKNYYNAHKLTHNKCFVSTVWGLLKT